MLGVRPLSILTHTAANAERTVVGGLLGIQHGREVEILNTFELVISEVDGATVIDNDYFNVRKDQCKLAISQSIVLVVVRALMRGIRSSQAGLSHL